MYKLNIRAASRTELSIIVHFIHSNFKHNNYYILCIA